MSLIDRLQRDCEYDPEGDSSVDALIEYKNALEDLVFAVDAAALDPVGTDLTRTLLNLGFGKSDGPQA